MTDPMAAASMDRTHRMVYYATLFYPFVNLLVMALMVYNGITIFSSSDAEVFYPMIIMLIVISLASLALIAKIKGWMWNMRKRGIHSIEDFSVAYFSTNIFGMAFLNSIGVYGLLFFFLIGNLPLAVGMNILSFIAMYLNFPKESEKQNLMKQFHFERMTP